MADGIIDKIKTNDPNGSGIKEYDIDVSVDYPYFNPDYKVHLSEAFEHHVDCGDSTATVVADGKAMTNKYGHVMITNSINENDQRNNGVVVTPKAVADYVAEHGGNFITNANYIDAREASASHSIEIDLSNLNNILNKKDQYRFPSAEGYEVAYEIAFASDITSLAIIDKKQTSSFNNIVYDIKVITIKGLSLNLSDFSEYFPGDNQRIFQTTALDSSSRYFVIIKFIDITE